MRAHKGGQPATEETVGKALWYIAKRTEPVTRYRLILSARLAKVTGRGRRRARESEIRQLTRRTFKLVRSLRRGSSFGTLEG
jgi:hypothetical protein